RQRELRQALIDGRAGAAMDVRHATQIVVVGVEAAGRLALGALDLGALELRGDGADDAGGHLVLQLEDVAERALIAFGPDVRAARSVDQLAGDAHAARRLAHAAFQQIARAELAASLLHVDSPALVGDRKSVV